MAGWHHWLDGRESEWTPGVGEGQGGLACCDAWGHKESDTTERLNWTELKNIGVRVSFQISAFVFFKYIPRSWTARRSNQSILKEISPGISWEGMMLKLKPQYFGHLLRRADSLEKTLMLGRIGAGGEGDDRGWDGWMASLTRWTWVWVNSGSWWWTGRPGVLRFMGSQSRTRLSDWSDLIWYPEVEFLGHMVFFVCFLLWHVACGILVLWSRIEPKPGSESSNS